MTTPRTFTLCCNGARCPVVTEIANDQFEIVDDDSCYAVVTSQDLKDLERMGSAAPSPDTTIAYGGVSMRADQAALATRILNQ